MILPQIDLRNAVISQTANRFQRRFFIREEEAARRLSCSQDASSPELGIDPLDGNPEASCQLSNCQIACDDRPPSLPRPAFEPVFKTNALDCDRQNLVCLPWRVMPFLRQNARDLLVMQALFGQCAYQSEQLRARRVTSIDRTRPISPRVTRATRSLNPFLWAAPAPLCPRSLSITSMSASRHPSSRARCESAY
jgi:hypothetical protein